MSFNAKFNEGGHFLSILSKNTPPGSETPFYFTIFDKNVDVLTLNDEFVGELEFDKTQVFELLIPQHNYQDNKEE